MVNHRSCCVFGCKNYTSRAKKDVHMFAIPVDLERRRIWAERTGNPAIINAPLSTLYNKRLCEVHFDEKMFHDARRNKLIRTSVPLPYVPIADSPSPSSCCDENSPLNGLALDCAPSGNGSCGSPLHVEVATKASQADTFQSVETSAEDSNCGSVVAALGEDGTPTTNPKPPACMDATDSEQVSIVCSVPETIAQTHKHTANCSKEWKVLGEHLRPTRLRMTFRTANKILTVPYSRLLVMSPLQNKGD